MPAGALRTVGIGNQSMAAAAVMDSDQRKLPEFGHVTLRAGGTASLPGGGPVHREGYTTAGRTSMA